MKQKGSYAALFCLLSATLALTPAAAQAGPHGKEQPHAAAKEQPGPAPKEQPRHSGSPARYNPVINDLESLSQSAEDVYDLALAGKMDRIGKKLETLKKQAAALSYINDDGGMLLPRLGQTLNELDQAVATRNRLETMRFANRITLITATVGINFKPTIPTEVSLLDYNGRELGIWSEIRKTDKLSNIVMRMHLTWQALMPKLIEHDGTKELKRFSETMGRLESAHNAEEYGHLCRQVAADLSAIKAVFAKSPR